MAIVYASGTSRSLNRASLLSSSNTMTMMGWAIATSAPGNNAYFNLFAQRATVGISIWTTGGQTVWNIGTATDDDPGSVVSLNTWTHVTLTKDATASQDMYLNGVLDVASSLSQTGSTTIDIGNFAASGGGINAWTGRFAAVKIWNAVLTATEILQEMRQFLPVRTANLAAWYPFVDPTVSAQLTDYSGAGATLTQTGTAPTASTDGPPIPWVRGPSRIWVPAGGGGTTEFITPSGTLSSAGAVVYQPRPVYAGTMTSAGGLVRQAGTVLAGTLGSAGEVAKQPAVSMAGTLTTAGAAAMLRLVLLAVGGTLTTAGSLVRQVGLPLAGALTTVGALAKGVSVSQAGTLSTAGALSATRVVLLTLAGTLTSAGTLVMRVGIVPAGTLATAGAAVYRVSTSMAGTLATAGALTASRLVTLAVAGTLTTAGALATIRAAVLAAGGTLATAGSVVKGVSTSMAGALTTAGGLVTQGGVQLFEVALSGTLGLAGSLFIPVRRLGLSSITRAVSAANSIVRAGASAITRKGSPQ